MGSIEGFGQEVDLTATIRSILSAYTFGTGLFKELLQNSDDAKATKQVILLDWRSHLAQSLCNPILADKQGPALLAYNNGILSDSDWKGIRKIYESSKSDQSSKIGKYGQGFRSCYHVTDTPQILSGDHLVILDPQNQIHPDGGVRLNIADAAVKFQDQFSVFDCLVPEDQRGRFFNGTIFRLPLRTTRSRIKDQTVDAKQIENLLHEFIR
ncbi:ATPase domain of HSP90 chaperone/DNA topoisomerase II/histidine kinase, partial [Dentipellis sp. KUC8613]